jgi:hypothetical protein
MKTNDQTEIKARFDAWVEGRVVIPEDDEMPTGELSEEDCSLREDQKRWDQAAAKLFDQLRLCTDPMPPEICDELDLPQASTYAQAVGLIGSEPQRFGLP